LQTITSISPDEKRCNSSDNGYYLQLQPKLTKTEKKIVDVLEKNSGMMSPEQIKTEIEETYHIENVKAGTIRPLLRRLVQKRAICNPYLGWYCDKLTYDVRVKPLAVHNLRLHCVVNDRLEHSETEVEVGGVKIFVCFGKERGIISGRISYDPGMSRAACMLAIDKWASIAEEKLGHSLGEYILTRLEVNRDEIGASFDGSLTCATRDLLKDVIVERVYEKADCVRQEFCVRKNLTPQQLEKSLFEQGMDHFMVSVAGHEQDRKLSGIEKTQKFINSKLQDINDSNRAIERKIIAGASNEDYVARILIELKEENRKTLSTMSSKYNEVMDLLSVKTVENEELKRMVLQFARSSAELVAALAKKSEPEPIPSNDKNNLGAMKDYVK